MLSLHLLILFKLTLRSVSSLTFLFVYYTAFAGMFDGLPEEEDEMCDELDLSDLGRQVREAKDRKFDDYEES
jgi:hypothetical protein